MFSLLQLALTVFQSGSFGGLLPGLQSMSLKRAMATLSRGDDDDARPAKRVAKGKKPMRTEPVADVGVGPSAASKNEVPQAGGVRVCLRCSKRLHLAGESTSRNKTVPSGFRCDLTAFHKCSYCALTSHDCVPVGCPSAYVGFANASRRCQKSSGLLLKIWFSGVLL